MSTAEDWDGVRDALRPRPEELAEWQRLTRDRREETTDGLWEEARTRMATDPLFRARVDVAVRDASLRWQPPARLADLRELLRRVAEEAAATALVVTDRAVAGNDRPEPTRAMAYALNNLAGLTTARYRDPTVLARQALWVLEALGYELRPTTDPS